MLRASHFGKCSGKLAIDNPAVSIRLESLAIEPITHTLFSGGSMSFKTQQVLRTRVDLQTEGDSPETVPAGTRVAVMSIAEDSRVKVKVQDPNFPTLSNRRILALAEALEATSRGRPKTSAPSA